MKRVVLAMILSAVTAAGLFAEAVGPEEIDARRNRVNQAAMITLGSWALANIGTGAVLTFTTDGSLKYFHEMNALWNTVNLGLAGLGLVGSLRAQPSENLFASVDSQYGLEKTLLLNAGLDVGYIMTGLYLTERSKTAVSQSARLEGYGYSLMLQGGFLLGFDLVVYLIQRQSRTLVREALAPGAAEKR